MDDIRQLEGRQVEIKGTIRGFDGRVRGHHSAGKSTHAKAAKKTTTKQSESVSIEDPEEPQWVFGGVDSEWR